jgi:hypothetical protein
VIAALMITVSLWTQTPANGPAPACREWHECERLAQDADARGEYEQFHDLAWRAVQTGPVHNPELLYLLARAQSLSGRPHDALVMLERLAEMKFATAAATDDDFRAVRQLRQWPELEAMVIPHADVLPANSVPVAGAPSAVVPPALPRPMTEARRVVEEVLRLPGANVGSAGLAYDRVSSRFVVSDSNRRKLLIIDERSRHVVDLVTSESAGFYDITGLEIDPARGDLWVVSAEPQASALHKLQLVSGRPLERAAAPAELQPCRFGDVAVTPDGRVFVLDTTGGRLLRFRPTTHTFTPVATIHVDGPTSLAPAGDRFVFVAHASGIVRVDATSGAVEPLATSPEIALDGFQRVRWLRDSLVGVQRLDAGHVRTARVKITEGRAVAFDVVDDDVAAADQPVVAVSGNEFYLLVHEPGGDAGDVVLRRGRAR